MTNVGDLPLELLQLIIGYVGGRVSIYPCLYVNKIFYQATIPILWHTPRRTIWYYHHDLKAPSLLGCLEQSSSLHSIPLGHHMRYLSFRNCNDLDSVVQLLLLAPLLDDLTLYGMQVRDEHIEQIAQHCPQLRQVSLQHSDTISDLSIILLARHCRHLRHLTLAACPKLSPGALMELKYSALESLQINHCEGLEREEIALYIRFFNKLTLLSMDKSQNMDAFTRQLLPAPGDPDDFIPLALLTKFSISNAQKTTEDSGSLISFIQTHPLLESVTLSNCVVDYAALVALANFLPRLHFLDLSGSSGVSSKGLWHVIMSCPKLNFVKLRGCNIHQRHFSAIRRPLASHGMRWHDGPFHYLNDLNLEDIIRIRLDPFNSGDSE